MNFYTVYNCVLMEGKDEINVIYRTIWPSRISFWNLCDISKQSAARGFCL